MLFVYLFTPLGVVVINTDVRSDGGERLMLAWDVWLSFVMRLWLQRTVWLRWIAQLARRCADSWRG